MKAFPYVFQMLTLSSALSLKPRRDLMQKKQWPDQSWNLTHIRQQPVPETNSPPTVTRPGAEPTICKSDLQKVRPLPSVIFCFVLFSVFFCLFFTFWPYHRACGILVPGPGIEIMSPALQSPSVSHWTTREVPGPLSSDRRVQEGEE